MTNTNIFANSILDEFVKFTEKCPLSTFSDMADEFMAEQHDKQMLKTLYDWCGLACLLEWLDEVEPQYSTLIPAYEYLSPRESMQKLIDVFLENDYYELWEALAALRTDVDYKQIFQYIVTRHSEFDVLEWLKELAD